MSALLPKGDIVRRGCEVRFVPIADIGTLFDHLVGAGENSVRDRNTERLRGLKIDGQFEFGRLLDRQQKAVSAGGYYAPSGVQ
jgi:hypothetical protein